MRTVLAAALVAATFASPALATESTKLGLLDCTIEGGTGYIVGSTKDLACTFNPTDAGMKREHYVGTVRKIGLDIGTTNKQLMQWLVLAPTSSYRYGALAGSYVGASAEATAAVGTGANLLVGGSDKTVTLQPLSVSAQTGLNLAVGVSEFTLAPAH